MSMVLVWTDLRARFTPGAMGVPIAWPNDPFTPAEPPAPWLLVEVSGGASRPIELGGGIWVSEGQAWVHVFVPEKTGLDVANGLVDAVIAAFRGPPLEPVVYETISADPGGPGEENGNYWRTSVTADWKLQTFVPRE